MKPQFLNLSNLIKPVHQYSDLTNLRLIMHQYFDLTNLRLIVHQPFLRRVEEIQHPLSALVEETLPLATIILIMRQLLLVRIVEDQFVKNVEKLAKQRMDLFTALIALVL